MTSATVYDLATKDLDPPFAIVDLDAFDANGADLLRRAAGKPIRVVSKSVRCRYLLERVLARPGFEGLMCYSLAEAVWHVEQGTSEDIVVAYPTADHGALRRLAANDRARAAISIMVDSPEHLDLVDAALGQGHPEIRVCLELDASWRPLPGVHIGTRRSPVFSPRQAADLARTILSRKGFRLVGMGTALDWMISGRVFGAEEAKTAGLVHSVHEPGEVLGKARELAREIAATTSPVSVAVTRQLLYRMASAESPFPVHELDSRLIGGLGSSPDAVEGVVSFLQKRPPEFSMRVDTDQPPYLPWLNK